MKSLKKLFFFFSIFFIFAIPAFSYAQSSAGITLIPAKIDEKADPGSVFEKTLKITNESDVEKEFFLYKKNIKGVEVGGVPIFAKNSGEITGYAITDWIDIQEESIIVSPNDSVKVSFTISVPDTATPGSHFGGIFISAEPPKYRKIGAGVGYEVASIIHIRINGDVVDTARIRSFSTDKLIYGTKDVNFVARVENQGNILVQPYGSVEITSMFGSKPKVFAVNENLAGVFPRTIRDIEFNWKEDGFGFGRYEAIIALTYDGSSGQKTIDASLVFWVFPAKIMMIGFAVLLTIIIGGYFLTRYYINQAIIRAGGGRRIPPQRYRKQVGISRFTFVFTSLLIILVIFLLILLLFFA